MVSTLAPPLSVDVRHSCTIKILPQQLLVSAAARAARINPANAPATRMLQLAAPGVVIPPEHLALLTAKYWGSGGVRLTVGFLDNPPADLRARIISHMNAWNATANVQFVESAVNPQVRISRTAGDGYWSYLGVDILSIAADQPTMNLDSFTMNTADSEFHRVVRHETGHTLGFPHEHTRSQIVDRIDRAKAIAYFESTQGWSEAQVIAQVLTPLDNSALIATANADPDSIMCYWLPASIMTDGVAVDGGTDIDVSDAQFAASVYPRADLHGHLWHTLRHADGSWTGLGDVQGQFAIPGPVAAISGAAGAPGETQFAFTTSDGHLWHTLRRADGSWTGLGDVQGQFAIPGPVVAIAGASGLPGETQFMFATSDGHLWHTLRRADGSWTGLGDVQGQFAIPGPVTAVAGASGAPGETQFAFTTSDGHLWHTLRRADGSWTGLGDVQGQFAIPGPVAAVGGAAGAPGETQFAFTTSDGHLWHTLRRADGSWTGLGDVQGQFATPGPVKAVAGASGAPGETQFIFTT